MPWSRRGVLSAAVVVATGAMVGCAARRASPGAPGAPGVEATALATRRAGDPFFPVLELGTRGRPVQMLQAMLSTTPDGEFGESTKAAVIAYQRSVGMDPDGVVDDPAWLRLLRVLTVGSQGPLVESVQVRLQVPVTGQFTDDTRMTVVEFQQAAGMSGSGSVELLTWQALLQP